MIDNAQETLILEALKLLLTTKQETERNSGKLSALEESLVSLAPAFAENYQRRLAAMNDSASPDTSARLLQSGIESRLRVLKESKDRA